MSDRSNVDPVASGVPYTVTEVNGRPPAVLSDFTDHSIIELTVARGNSIVQILGSVHLDPSGTIVHEKDGDGIGKDVRVWVIRATDGGFEAVER